MYATRNVKLKYIIGTKASGKTETVLKSIKGFEMSANIAFVTSENAISDLAERTSKSLAQIKFFSTLDLKGIRNFLCERTGYRVIVVDGPFLKEIDEFFPYLTRITDEIIVSVTLQEDPDSAAFTDPLHATV